MFTLGSWGMRVSSQLKAETPLAGVTPQRPLVAGGGFEPDLRVGTLDQAQSNPDLPLVGVVSQRDPLSVPKAFAMAPAL